MSNLLYAILENYIYIHFFRIFLNNEEHVVIHRSFFSSFLSSHRSSKLSIEKRRRRGRRKKEEGYVSFLLETLEEGERGRGLAAGVNTLANPVVDNLRLIVSMTRTRNLHPTFLAKSFIPPQHGGHALNFLSQAVSKPNHDIIHEFPILKIDLQTIVIYPSFHFQLKFPFSSSFFFKKFKRFVSRRKLEEREMYT